MQPFIPLYEKLVNEYERQILERELVSGDKIDSITQIQKKHGVARETAKRCLKILVEKGLIVQKRGQGSFVADLAPKKRVWGFIIPFFSIHYDQCIRELRNRAASLDRELRHFCSYSQWQEEMRLVGSMLQERYEAIIVVPSREEAQTEEFYLSLSSRDSKVIFFDSVLFNTSCAYATQNYGIGVIRAIEHIKKRRRGSIAFVKDDIWHGNNPMFEMMENIFVDDHAKRMPEVAPIIIDRIDESSIRSLLEEGVVGFLCSNDYRALRLLGLLKELGVDTAQEVSVVSFGNTDIAKYFTPSITSIDFHYEKMIAATIAMITDKKVPQQVIVDVDLVIRQT